MRDGTDYFDDYADSVARDKKTANPEPKVSEKARELAEQCRNLPAPYDYATLIQSSLSELLEAGRELAEKPSITRCTRFAAILSKWEPPK